MKSIVLSLALVACAMANVSELGYVYSASGPVAHPHHYEHHEQHEIIADVPRVPGSAPALVYHPAPVYNPAPVQHYVPASVHYHETAPGPVHGPASLPVAPQNIYTSPAQGGYRYMTVRRIVHRRRF